MNVSGGQQMNDSGEQQMTFWEHLDVLRKVMFRCIAVWVVCAVLAFCFKDWLFAIVFAPSRGDFVLYRVLCAISQRLCAGDFTAQFINTELASQFMTHLRVAAWVGVVVAFPYLVIQLYGFIAPALYQQEKSNSVRLIFFGSLLFALGVLLNYFVIFPFSFRFLSTYQVVGEVVNQISLSSYVDTLLMLSLLMGILFEIPIVIYFMAKVGLVDADMLRAYRRHAFVAITIVAAVITPTADIFTLMLVTLPIYGLYELSIAVVR